MISKDLSLVHLIRPAKTASGRAPALFLFHGYGSNEEDLFSFAPELPGDLFVISVRAPHALEPFGFAWYAINFEAEKGKWSDVDQAVRSREAMSGFISEAVASYDLDPERVSLLGFSQGTVLSYALALSYPERFRCLVGLSGYIDPAMLVPGFREKDHSSLQVYASHGQLDMVIPPAWAEQAADFLGELGIRHTFEEYPVGHGVAQDNFRSFCKWLEGRY